MYIYIYKNAEEICFYTRLQRQLSSLSIILRKEILLSLYGTVREIPRYSNGHPEIKGGRRSHFFFIYNMVVGSWSGGGEQGYYTFIVIVSSAFKGGFPLHIRVRVRVLKYFSVIGWNV